MIQTDKFRDTNERFIFQGGSMFAKNIANEIDYLRSRVAELEAALEEALRRYRALLPACRPRSCAEEGA